MANRVAWEDESCFCERCGISFVWTIEEQKQQAAAQGRDQRPAPQDAPTHCAGCRVLLPPPARERGIVKWYNLRKRYGFIVRQGQPDIFVPAAAIRGSKRLNPGDLVEFRIGENSSGPAAEDVRLLVAAADQPALPAPLPAERRSVARLAPFRPPSAS